MVEGRLLADTVSQLEVFVKAAEREVHLQQNEISRVKFIIQVLRDGSDATVIFHEMEKMKIASQQLDIGSIAKDDIASLHKVDIGSLANGHTHLGASQVDGQVGAQHNSSNDIRDRYLRTAKEWIASTVTASRTPIEPREIFHTAQQAGIKMHKNYPYVVLKKLVEEGRIKQLGRGYVGSSFT